MKLDVKEIRGRLGMAIIWMGILGLPLGLGVVLGYYASDRGLLWLPTMLYVLLVLSITSILAIIGGGLLARRTIKSTEGGLRLRRRVMACFVLLTALLVGWLALYWTEQPSALTELSHQKFNQAFEVDAERYREYDNGLARQYEAFAAFSELFEEGRDRVLTADEESTIRSLWTTTYDYAFGLDQIRLFYEDWYRFDPSRAQRSYHLRSYLLTFTSELSLYEMSSRLVALITRNPNVVKFLDTPHEEAGIAANSFSQFRDQLQGTRDHARVVAGRRYLLWLEKAFQGREEARALGCHWLWEKAESKLGLIDAYSPIGLAALTLSSDFENFRRAVDRVWYPTQKGVAKWMGDTRLRRIGVYLITPEQQEEMDKRLEPGDVMLSRKNWHLSNIGLPGFWPHAVLYIGGPEKFDAYFDDAEVRAYVGELSGEMQSLRDYLARQYPTRWLRYTAGDHGEPYRVIEGIAAGVVLNTFSRACGDYMAVLRPRLDKKAKAQAIVEAFGHLDKPYDYNFDFATDHALVCTELVWRSYRPAEGKAGLKLEPIMIAGRRSLPAQEFARLFSREHGRPSAQFDFVYFLDAVEKDARAFIATEADFLKTLQRTKWDLALE